MCMCEFVCVSVVQKRGERNIFVVVVACNYRCVLSAVGFVGDSFFFLQ